MMKTGELLERDKERLLSQLSKADTPDSAIAVMEEELNRILYQYNEKCTDERESAAAAQAFRTVKAALSLADSTGEVRVYERKDSLPAEASPLKKAAVPLCAGGAASAASALMLAFAGTDMRLPAFIVLVAGLGAVFFAGMKAGGGNAAAETGERHFETRPDSQRLYRGLMTALAVVDRNLEDVRSMADEETGTALSTGGSGTVTEDTLRLMQELLENAYAAGDVPEAQQMVSDIRFWLHRNGIEAVNYEDGTEKWFDRIPAGGGGTIRPALIRAEGTLLLKGLAAGK